MEFEALPTEIKLYILKYLTYVELSYFALTSTENLALATKASIVPYEPDVMTQAMVVKYIHNTCEKCKTPAVFIGTVIVDGLCTYCRCAFPDAETQFLPMEIDNDIYHQNLITNMTTTNTGYYNNILYYNVVPYDKTMSHDNFITHDYASYIDYYNSY
jgi:hypothetical protein